MTGSKTQHHEKRLLFIHKRTKIRRKQIPILGENTHTTSWSNTAVQLFNPPDRIVQLGRRTASEQGLYYEPNRTTTLRKAHSQTNPQPLASAILAPETPSTPSGQMTCSPCWKPREGTKVPHANHPPLTGPHSCLPFSEMACHADHWSIFQTCPQVSCGPQTLNRPNPSHEIQRSGLAWFRRQGVRLNLISAAL
jgi:hypothetical protein